jgi:hypothetical protein
MSKLALLAVALVGGCFVTPGQIQASNEQFYQRICTDSQYAYEHGYNKGRTGEPMSTRWAERCAPEVRAERQQAYVAGYQAATGPAPASGLQINVGISGTTAGGGTTACSYDADCGPGRACRSIGGSNTVCMGQGAAGDYCYYDADCLSRSCAPANGAMYCR